MVTREDPTITVDLNGCARCQGNGHKGLTFFRLTYPFQPVEKGPLFTHWAWCPTNGEPILMRLSEAEAVMTLISGF